VLDVISIVNWPLVDNVRDEEGEKVMSPFTHNLELASVVEFNARFPLANIRIRSVLELVQANSGLFTTSDKTPLLGSVVESVNLLVKNIKGLVPLSFAEVVPAAKLTTKPLLVNLCPLNPGA
jgi:hypothetical protein